jgi:serine/threonine protein kinase
VTPPKRSASQSGLSDQTLALLVEELTAHLRQDDSAAVAALLGAHPEHAEELGRLLPALAGLAELERSRPRGPLAAQGAEADGRTLGDFRLLREIGRGGMGVVYAAEQLSLGRRVALKVLPFAAALDARQLQRFRNEAQAAAQLHHTNIVPVHYVGCERGVHFYAMQFIEGQTLAEVIADLRARAAAGTAVPQAPTGPYEPTPARGGLTTERSVGTPEYFRTVAWLGVQAAEALDHAHQGGVVHRDVKPANLLVDGSGHLWVTDFGLAQVQGEAQLTLTGDLVGTLRYMSPEQALGQRVVLDHRTDVYSLGATLYELLTLDPAFSGRDRQEILRRIAFEEPCRPRRIRPTVPRELETIVLKAMAKEPEGRYATAGELAEDLRRYLEDRPIRARQPTLRQRAARWARRHRSVVWGAVLALVVVAAGSVVAAALIARERAAAVRERDEALAQRHKAFQALGLLTAELRVGRPGEPSDMVPTPDRAALEQVLDFYEEFLRDNGSDPGLRQETDLARERVAQVQNRLAWLLATPRDAPGRDADRAVFLARQAVARSPRNWAYWNTLGVARYRAGSLEQAIVELDRSRCLRGVDDSYNAFFLAMAHWKLGHRDEARHWYEKGLAWMKPYPTDPELVAFRTEAAAVLEITKDSTPRPPAPTRDSKKTKKSEETSGNGSRSQQPWSPRALGMRV